MMLMMMMMMMMMMVMIMMMMMLLTWSGRRIWRPSTEVSSSAENCNLDKNKHEMLDFDKKGQTLEREKNHQYNIGRSPPDKIIKQQNKLYHLSAIAQLWLSSSPSSLSVSPEFDAALGDQNWAKVLAKDLSDLIGFC